MRLPTGQYFANTDCRVELDGVCFSAMSYQPLLSQPWHTHECATFFLHVAGDQVDEGTGAGWQLPTFALSYHSTAAQHRGRFGPAGGKGIDVAVSDEWLTRNAINCKSLGDHRVLHNEQIQHFGLHLIRMYGTVPPTGQELSDLAIELLEPLLPMVREPLEDPRWLRKAESLMRERFQEPIGLSAVAAEVGVHPVYLASVFRRKHGRSVVQHLQRLRVESAVNQILGGESVGIAAVTAGFCDQFHFSRTLQAHYGYRPTFVRRLAQSCS